MKKLFYILSAVLLSQFCIAQQEFTSIKLTNTPVTINDTLNTELLVRYKTAGPNKGKVVKSTWSYLKSVIASLSDTPSIQEVLEAGSTGYIGDATISLNRTVTGGHNEMTLNATAVKLRTPKRGYIADDGEAGGQSYLFNENVKFYVPKFKTVNDTLVVKKDIENLIGNFIPLSGTVSGSPVTGNIELAYDSDTKGFIQTIGNLVSVLGIGDNPQMSFKDNSTGYLTSLNVANEGIALYHDLPSSKGLISARDFSPNNDGTDRNIYPQTGWVQDHTQSEIENSIDATPVDGSLITSVSSNWVYDYAAAIAMSLAGKVGTTGNETISGVKTFSSSPIAPTQSANDNSTKVSTTAYSDAKVADFINDGATTIAPSQNIVFDNLALKAPINNASHTGTFTLPNGSLVITSGASTDVILGTGAATPAGPLVRAQTINGDTSTGTALSSGMVIPRAIWELQRLITLMPVYIVNSTTTVLSSSSLNSTYPNVGIGSRISCRSITTGGIMYVKDTEAGSGDVWNMMPITVAP